MKRSIIKECLRRARAKNSPSTHTQWHSFMHYSFVVQNNKVIEMGVNRQGSVPKHYGYQKHKMIHAEVDAYKKARGILSDGGFEVVNIRLNRRGDLRESCPCPECFHLMREFGCTRFHFSTNPGIFATMSTQE